MKKVTQADIDAAREYMADVHNLHQWTSAISQLRPEVAEEMTRRGLMPAISQATER